MGEWREPEYPGHGLMISAVPKEMDPYDTADMLERVDAAARRRTPGIVRLGAGAWYAEGGEEAVTLFMIASKLQDRECRDHLKALTWYEPSFPEGRNKMTARKRLGLPER